MSKITDIFCIGVIVIGFGVLMSTPDGRDSVPGILLGTAIGCLLGWIVTRDD